MKPRISAVILTLNEERNIGNALASVASWVDEIIVVDMFSEDRTVEIAESFGAKVYTHERLGFQDPARPFAMEKSTCEWIVNLDADEIVSVSLRHELLRIAELDLADVCEIPWLCYIGGKPMLHTGWTPDENRQYRFFKRQAVSFSPNIHVRPMPAPNARIIKMLYRSGHYLIHFNYLGANHFLSKLNRYTDIEAQQALDRGERASYKRILLSPLKEFHWRYLRAQGYRDGLNGFLLLFPDAGLPNDCSHQASRTRRSSHTWFRRTALSRHQRSRTPMTSGSAENLNQSPTVSRMT